jgi:hypothetical protein
VQYGLKYESVSASARAAVETLAKCGRHAREKVESGEKEIDEYGTHQICHYARHVKSGRKFCFFDVAVDGWVTGLGIRFREVAADASLGFEAGSLILDGDSERGAEERLPADAFHIRSGKWPCHPALCDLGADILQDRRAFFDSGRKIRNDYGLR